MKKIIVLVCACLCVNLATYAQTKAPAAVESAFKQKFPKASQVKWGKENASEYEAEFKIDGKKYSANFNTDGKWLETEATITLSELPAKVRTAYQTSNKGVQPKAVAQIKKADGATKYEVEVKHGVKTVELFYDENGNKTTE